MTGVGNRWREPRERTRSIRMTERRGLVAAALLCMVLIVLTLAIVVETADAAWPRLDGKASVFGNDPAAGFVDYADNCRTATGTSCTSGGIAVMNYRTLGGWWWVCAPRRVVPRHVQRCHLVKQSEIGPARWTGRVLDVTAVTARRAWRLPARGFPTDTGRWTLRYRGRR